MPKTIAIAGGGASGLAAAVAAKQASPKAQVLLLERGDRVGRKILATGNGRCNLTNLAASPERYSGTDLRPAASLLRRYSPETVLAFFEDLGLLARAEDEGRVYPASGRPPLCWTYSGLPGARSGRRGAVRLGGPLDFPGKAGLHSDPCPGGSPCGPESNFGGGGHGRPQLRHGRQRFFPPARPGP